jgi:hypothetical protein
MRFVTVMVLDPAEAPAWAAAEFEIGWVNAEGVEEGMALAAGGGGAVRLWDGGAAFQIPQGPATSERVVVVCHHGWACGV